MITIARRRLSAWPLAILLALLLVPLFLGIPAEWRHDPLVGPLGDRYHIVLFLLLPVILYRHGPLAGRGAVTILVCVALGGATELLQIPAGRSAALWDWYQDALGVGLGACWLWFRETGRRLWPGLVAAMLALLVVWPLRQLPAVVRECRRAEDRFPVLDDFESPNALILWSGHDGAELARTPVAGRGHALQMRSGGTERWPGVTTNRLPWDWRGHSVLRLACRAVTPSDSLRVSIWLEDRAAGRDRDRAVRTFLVGGEWQALEIPLRDLLTRERERPLALAEVTVIAIYASRRQPGPIVLFLDDLRLDDG
ncbi:MAG TPA: hypothetical protein PLL30_02660 [Candidatus Krumholzibacteria bacterium]|nr:hypothetical protein [Candidatus Krumholzibacteria bacterium]HPD70671.1 hypothetical protein [Candidatus Krumholzibacteria bacterium]HRY39629.1 hypothetical protein [Candidatus Krumholzibacteria bacterium]